MAGDRERRCASILRESWTRNSAPTDWRENWPGSPGHGLAATASIAITAGAGRATFRSNGRWWVLGIASCRIGHSNTDRGQIVGRMQQSGDRVAGLRAWRLGGLALDPGACLCDVRAKFQAVAGCPRSPHPKPTRRRTSASTTPPGSPPPTPRYDANIVSCQPTWVPATPNSSSKRASSACPRSATSPRATATGRRLVVSSCLSSPWLAAVGGWMDGG